MSWQLCAGTARRLKEFICQRANLNYSRYGLSLAVSVD
jgi:hypothetical protein